MVKKELWLTTKSLNSRRRFLCLIRWNFKFQMFLSYDCYYAAMTWLEKEIFKYLSILLLVVKIQMFISFAIYSGWWWHNHNKRAWYSHAISWTESDRGKNNIYRVLIMMDGLQKVSPMCNDVAFKGEQKLMEN